MAKRDFLQITDSSRKEIEQLFDLAKRMKARAYRETPLAGKTLAMIFAKSSTRTRVSFEVGAYQLGGRALFLSSHDIQLSRGEPIADTARVLSRYVDGIMIRTFDHNEVVELARHATILVINGLTDPKAIFLHGRPAHRGEEVTTEVIEGPQSRVWDEAENRLHVQKALLAVLMG